MVFNYTVGWEHMIAGRLIDAGLYPYTHLIGNMFYGVIAFMALSMIYFKTQDYGTTGVAGLIIAATSITFLPVEVRFLAVVMLATSLTIVMYKLMKG